MDFQHVISSDLYKVAYDNSEQTLAIIFKSNKKLQYHYIGVPEKIYDKLLEAHSKGVFFNRNIKGKYIAKKIRGIPQ